MAASIAHLAVAYSTLMLILYPTLVPKVYEKASRRPGAVRLTWVAAALIPLMPLTPLAALLLPPAALLAARGKRLESLLVSLGALLHAVIVCTRLPPP